MTANIANLKLALWNWCELLLQGYMPWCLRRARQSSTMPASSIWKSGFTLSLTYMYWMKLSSKLSYSCNPIVPTILQIKYPDLITLNFCEEPIKVCQWLMWHLLSNTISALKLFCNRGKKIFLFQYVSKYFTNFVNMVCKWAILQILLWGKGVAWNSFHRKSIIYTTCSLINHNYFGLDE